MEDRTKPMRYAIANGFAIGEFPAEITRQEPTATSSTREIDIGELSDKMKAMVAPV